MFLKTSRSIAASKLLIFIFKLYSLPTQEKKNTRTIPRPNSSSSYLQRRSRARKHKACNKMYTQSSAPRKRKAQNLFESTAEIFYSSWSMRAYKGLMRSLSLSPLAYNEIAGEQPCNARASEWAAV